MEASKPIQKKGGALCLPLRFFKCKRSKKIMQEFLNDEVRGRTVEWRERKEESLIIGGSYQRAGKEKKAARTLSCGNYLEFKEFGDGTKKLNDANFCTVRLCPMCSWRKSLKMYGIVSEIMDYIETRENYQYLFLTLTAKNVRGRKLCGELDNFFHAFNKMSELKIYDETIKGWFRALEVTHSWKRNDYHPHFHVLLAVGENYAKKGFEYIEHEEWMKIWRKCLNVNYDPSVDIRAVKPVIDGSFKYRKVIAEITKYAVKSMDLIYEPSAALIKNKGKTFAETYAQKKTDEAVEHLDVALHGRRMTAFGGSLREAKKILKIDKEKEKNLIDVDLPEIREDLAYILVRYVWSQYYRDYLKAVVENESYD